MELTECTVAECGVFAEMAQRNPGTTPEIFRNACTRGRYFSFHYYARTDRPPLVDLAPLAKLEGLERIELIHCAVSDLTPLAGLTSLRILNITSNTAVLQPCDLTALHDLERFYYMGPITALPNLHGLPHLTSVGASSCEGLTDLSSLAGLTSLKRLWISHNPGVKDLSPLAQCPALEKLDAYETGIADLTPLRGLQNLKEVTLSSNPITDVSPLVECPALELVWLYGTLVEDVACLAALPKLNSLNLYKTNVTDLSAFQGRESILVIERKKLGKGKSKKSAAEVKEAIAAVKAKMAARGLQARPVLSKAQIQAFEERVGVRLPREYTAFLTQVGDGFTQDQLPDQKILAFPPLEQAAFDPERIAKRFNFREAWIWEDDEKASEEKILSASRNGQIHFTDCGCGLSHSLILCGSAKGEVWEIADVGAAPYHSGADFLDWLLDALEERSSRQGREPPAASAG